MDDTDDLPVLGGCLCAEVSYRVTGPLAPVVACHCDQCRRTSGHHAATTSASRRDIEVEGEVRWYQSSEAARRGFCPECGSSLFWDNGGDRLFVFAGSLDKPTGLQLQEHVHCGSKGDYYEIKGDLPQSQGRRRGAERA